MMISSRCGLLFACVFAIYIVSPVTSSSSFLSSLFADSKYFFQGSRSTHNEHPFSSWRSSGEQENSYITSGIRMRIYTGPSIETASVVTIPVDETELIYNSLDHSKPLVLYIHGFREHPANESIRTVVGAHLERGNDNIMLLDWSDLAFENYVIVAARTRDVARTLARTFDDLIHLGLDLETFHCVGHSLGAQIGGFLGKYSSNSIPRITGLDPANPGFYLPGAKHIDADSARFVDIIHTDGGLYGALSSTGTVDFYANGGTRPQPGCPVLGVPLTPSDLCNHWRSWRYYAESVLNEFAFPAVQCPSWGDFIAGRCTFNQYIYAGYATPTYVQGSYYFTTNDKTPFSKSAEVYTANLLES